MLICMRTTLNLDDDLIREVKRRAADRRQTMTQVIEQALREHLVSRPAPPDGYRFDLPTVRGRRRPGVDFTDRDALYALMESDS